MASKKVKYRVGDVFLIPSSRYGCYVGQVAVDIASEIGALFCFIFDKKVSHEDECEYLDLKCSDIISANLITPELIKHGVWKVCRNMPVPMHPALHELEIARRHGFVGSRVVGSGLVAEYLDTFYGVIDVNRWPDPKYVWRFFLAHPSTS